MNNTKKNTHYVYLIQVLNTVNKTQWYIGCRSCKSIDTDTNYIGSSKHLKKFVKNNNPKTRKKILSVWKTRKEAITEEIRLHNLHDVAKNGKYFNKAKQTSTGFDTTGCGYRPSAEHIEILKNSQKGKIKSKESIAKMRKALIGRKLSEQHKINISKGGKGRVFSENHKQKISESTIGKRVSEKTKKKLSEAAIERYIKSNHPCNKPVVNLDNGMLFESASIASKWANAQGVKHVCRGVRKTAGGYRWAYVDSVKEVA